MAPGLVRGLLATRLAGRRRYRFRFRLEVQEHSSRPVDRALERVVSFLFAFYLNEVLALGLCDERLELRCREGVHEARLRDDEQEDLSAGEDGKLVGLK